MTRSDCLVFSFVLAALVTILVVGSIPSHSHRVSFEYRPCFVHVVHRRPSWLHVCLSIYQPQTRLLLLMWTLASLHHTPFLLFTRPNQLTRSKYLQQQNQRGKSSFSIAKKLEQQKSGDETARKWIFGQLFSAECRPRTRNTGSKWVQKSVLILSPRYISSRMIWKSNRLAAAIPSTRDFDDSIVNECVVLRLKLARQLQPS